LAGFVYGLLPHEFNVPILAFFSAASFFSASAAFGFSFSAFLSSSFLASFAVF